jgi:hypothetical protein
MEIHLYFCEEVQAFHVFLKLFSRVWNKIWRSFNATWQQRKQITCAGATDEIIALERPFY